VLEAQAVFILECGHTDTQTDPNTDQLTDAAQCPIPHIGYAGMG